MQISLEMEDINLNDDKKGLRDFRMKVYSPEVYSFFKFMN